MRKGTAYRKLKSQRETIRDKVFAYIKSVRGGVSTYQIRDELNLKAHTLSGRLSELEQSGLIYQKGITEQTVKGVRSVSIWQHTPKKAVEARRVENHNKRMLLWFNKGKKNGFVTARQLNNIKSQTTLF